MGQHEKSYGIAKQHQAETALEQSIEELKINGFTIIPNVYSVETLTEVRTRLDTLLTIQENEFGRSNLDSIQDANMVRLPLAYDSFFLDMATQKLVLDVVRAVMGNYIVLHLQNGIINKPGIEHHQSSWHRDLPYQDFVISQPLAISALYCIDDFTPETGGTFMLPFSHKLEKMPSRNYVEKHAIQPIVKAGSVILFDSMLHHKAGSNTSSHIRRGINHVYAAGILKQQINLPAMLGGKYADDPFLYTFLGYASETANSVEEWRKKKLRKTNT